MGVGENGEKISAEEGVARRQLGLRAEGPELGIIVTFGPRHYQNNDGVVSQHHR